MYFRLLFLLIFINIAKILTNNIIYTYKYNSSLYDGNVPCFFKYILFVWFSKSYAYPIEGRKKKIDTTGGGRREELRIIEAEKH